MLLIIALRAARVHCCLVLLSACGVAEPGSRRDDAVVWEVAGEMSTMPLVADSLLIAPLVDGRLVAYRRRDGSIAWQRQFQGEFRSERLLRVGSVLIVPHFALHGVDVHTGALLWTYGGVGGDAGVITPEISGDRVFVAGYSVLPDSANYQGGAVFGGVVVDDRVILGTFTSRVLALRVSDGAFLWERVAGNPATAFIVSQPRFFGGLVALLRGDGVLEGRSVADGSVQWSTILGGSLVYSPSTCSPFLCFANGRVWIIDTTGKIVWAFGGGSEIVFLSNVAVDSDGIMYAGIVKTNRTGAIRAFRPPIAVGPTP